MRLKRPISRTAAPHGRPHVIPPRIDAGSPTASIRKCTSAAACQRCRGSLARQRRRRSTRRGFSAGGKPREIDVGLEHARELLRRRVALERPAPAEQLVEDAAKREDVAAFDPPRGPWPARGHVTGDTQNHAGRCAAEGRGRVRRRSPTMPAALQKLRRARSRALSRRRRVSSIRWPASGRGGDPFFVRRPGAPRSICRATATASSTAAVRARAAGQRLAFDELQHQEDGPARFGEIVDGGDARVIERRHGLRLAMKARDSIRIAG